MRAALDSMEDPILHLAVHLTLVGALREGEVAGLTLSLIHISVLLLSVSSIFVVSKVIIDF